MLSPKALGQQFTWDLLLCLVYIRKESDFVFYHTNTVIQCKVGPFPYSVVPTFIIIYIFFL